MVMSLGLFLIIIVVAFVCELIDASLGMGYGTILSPLLIGLGFDPLFVVPAVLMSQAVGGFAASMFHQRYKNVSFSLKSKDTRVFLIITGAGVLATIFAAIVAINIPKVALNTYIAVLVIAVGTILLINLRLRFNMWAMGAVGVVSAFNKGISGGGFGPLVTGGQIISGHKAKRAVGVTTLAEAPICIASFITWLIAKLAAQSKAPLLSRPVGEIAAVLFSNQILRWDLMLSLFFGVLFVAPLAPYLTKKIHHKVWNYILGPLIILLGIWVIIKTFFWK
ncbi:sulfite exporter TauE/SafE family protein [candidate division WOR-3 bacterium]|nr:sulfite exporter TauE/SafE family protein [candidate division WOR-3 bacterium]